MWAVVEIAKKQYFVEKGFSLKAEKLAQKEGNIVFDKVLLTADGNNVKVGRPYINEAKVEAQILGEQKGDKVISFKYRRRKKSRRIRGHRQIYTHLKISDITIS